MPREYQGGPEIKSDDQVATATRETVSRFNSKWPGEVAVILLPPIRKQPRNPLSDGPHYEIQIITEGNKMTAERESAIYKEILDDLASKGLDTRIAAPEASTEAGYGSDEYSRSNTYAAQDKLVSWDKGEGF